MGLTGLATSQWAAVTVGMGNKCNVIKKVKSACGKKITLQSLVLSKTERNNSYFNSRVVTEIRQKKTVAKHPSTFTQNCCHLYITGGQRGSFLLTSLTKYYTLKKTQCLTSIWVKKVLFTGHKSSCRAKVMHLNKTA